MIIRFLGTGTSQGIPVINCTCKVCTSLDTRNSRLRSSLWVQTDKNSILIDIGPDFRQQALANGIKRLDAILLTHEHADHTAGMDDIRPICFEMGHKIPLFSEARVLLDIQKRFYYIFGENNYPGLPQLELREIIADQPFLINSEPILPIRIWHGTLGVLAFQIGTLVYITDAKHIDEAGIEKMKHCEVLVINALRHKEHHSHLNLTQAIDIIHKIQPKQSFLTHISHQLGLHHEVEEILEPDISLAYDGLVISI
ncbi:MAG: MBL fold metallo-hydrolase [Saprospiraceae bacterium]